MKFGKIVPRMRRDSSQNIQRMKTKRVKKLKECGETMLAKLFRVWKKCTVLRKTFRNGGGVSLKI